MSEEEWNKRKREFPTTLAADILNETGLAYNRRLYWVIIRAYAYGDIDGSLGNLIRLVKGDIYLREFGPESRLQLAAAIIDWLRSKSE